MLQCVDVILDCGVLVVVAISLWLVFFFQAEDGIRDLVRSRGLGDVYKRQSPLRAVTGQHRAHLDGVADLDAHFLDGPVVRGVDVGVHLHGVEHEGLRLRLDRGAGLHLSLIHISEPTRPY